MRDLDDVWRDDQLIEALARREPVDTTDPAAAPLRALTGLVDAAPMPEYDIRGLENLVLLDTGRSRRVAVRSLAVALTAVATLSTSGVAAVVTGDPFQPAKVVWHQIQERAGDRWGPDSTTDEDRLDSGSAIGGDATGSGGTGSGGTGRTAGFDGTETTAQAALLETARRAEEPPRLQRVALPRPAAGEKDGLEAGQVPSQDRAVAEADATAEPQPSSPPPEETTAEKRQARQEERASAAGTGEDSTQESEETQRSEEEQEAQDSRRSDQPEEDEQQPTPDPPADELDPWVAPDGTEDPGDHDDSRRSGEEDEESDEAEEDAEESDGAAVTEPAPEDTSSTEEPTAEESEDDGPLAILDVEQRAGSTDETVAPPRLNR